jgi:hypothetical protein
VDKWANAPYNVYLFLTKEENTVSQWELKFNSVPAVVKTWHLKGCLTEGVQEKGTWETI